MLSPRLTDCVIDASIPVTLTQIDERLTYWANRQYNNIIFSMNNCIPGEIIDDLLHYKQILTYRLCTPTYAMVCGLPTTSQVVSRVKVLIHK
jgi:hypothetical protein